MTELSSTTTDAVDTQDVVVLGATGTIGDNTLDVIRRHRDRYRVVALSANKNVAAMAKLVEEFSPQCVVMGNDAAAADLRKLITNPKVEFLSGEHGLCEISAHPDVDTVVAGIVGAAGLTPVLAAARAGKRILLANKEPMVMLGGTIMQAAEESGAVMLPLDSEHNAIFQCLPQHRGSSGEAEMPTLAGVRRVVLTASGGPFRTFSESQLHAVTPEQACRHPNWVMGRKISVDSATLMNKGLEVIEACWLFGIASSDIDVVVHPQSVIHSLVEYLDGSMLAQLGSPDMRVPIAHALAWPERIDSGAARLDLIDIAKLEFEPPDINRFPCLRLAGDAAREGGTAPAVLNAANEIAVHAFLEGQVGFNDIARINEQTLSNASISSDVSLDAVLFADAQARSLAAGCIDASGRTR